MNAAPDLCPCCEQPMPPGARARVARRGGLMIDEATRTTYWRGMAMRGLSPMQTKFLFLLASRKGPVSIGAFEMLLRDNTSSPSEKVHIHRVRTWLSTRNLPFEIKTHRGLGYELTETAPS